MGTTDSRTEPELHADRGQPRQQRCVGAVAGEMLSRRHLDDAERADDDPDYQRGPAAADQTDDQRHGTGKDRELGDRQSAERARRPLPITPEFTPGPPRARSG